MMKTTDLKPCPFCGGKAMILEYSCTNHGTEKILIGCTRCGARLEAEKRFLMIEKTGEYGQKIIVNSGICIQQGAVEQWNRRVTDENA